ncbi:MAG: two-component regulator propeller domain-containing protein [Bacteroidota bacterium]|jgi:ligand-binding sensor domain-containing protein/signal transduction histidine kinase
MKRINIKAIAVAAMVALYSLLPNNSYAQNIQFKHITNNDGLSDLYVRCIIQDDQGFMWLGTFDGLNKYDGYGFTVYRHRDNDSNSLPTNIIRYMYKDDNNDLWIGTSRGLCLYDRDHDNFINFNKENGYALNNFSIECMLKDSKGNFWIGTEEHGLILFDSRKNQYVQYLHHGGDSSSISGNTVRQIFEDSRHNLWISTAGYGLNIFDYNKRSFSHVNHKQNDPNSIIGNSVYSIVEDHEGYIWFACLQDGLSSIHVDQIDKRSFKNFQHDSKNKNSLCDPSIRVLCVDIKGGLWIGSEHGGLNYLPKGKESFISYINDANDPNSLNCNSIYSIYQDATDDIWIGTYTAGINVLHQTQQTFKHYNHLPGRKNTLSHNYVWDFSEDKEGNIWIATDGGGLNKFSPETRNFESFSISNSNLNKNAVLTTHVDSHGNVWVGTWHGGLSLFNSQTKSFKAFTRENSGLSNNDVFDIAEDNQGTLWIATHGGLNKFNKDKNSFTVYNKENSGIVDDQIEVVKTDSAGNILIGSINGFSIYDPKKYTFVNYLHDSKNSNSISDDFITSIYCENETIIWIATINGLNKLERKTQRVTRFSMKDGLANNLVYGIEKDNQGNLWISTNGGLTHYVVNTNQFITFTKEDGLQENIFIKKSHYKTRNGKLLFGGINGFNIFDPQEVKTNQAIPQVIFADFQIFNKSAELGAIDSPLKRQISQTKEIVLSYKQNVFSFGFSALNYINSTRNQYAYILEGFDKDWNYIGTRRTASYTNINPGRYLFRVKASNNNGVWNEEGASLTLIITPPFWETIWFRLIGILLVISIVIAWYKIRTARIRAHNRELQQRVAERTAQLEAANKELEAFAYSVSHDLRAPLRAIDGFVHILIEDYMPSLNEAGRHACSVISNEAKRMDLLIEDFLSLSHSSYTDIHISLIDMESMVHSVFDELTRTGNRERIDFRVGSLQSTNGDPALIREVWINLISNAIKFSSKRERAEIEIGCQQDGHRVIYFVRDNGVGFDMKYSDKLFGVFQRLHSEKEFAGTGVGLAIVKRLINRHGGETWAESQKDEGAIFYFTVMQKGETR